MITTTKVIEGRVMKRICWMRSAPSTSADSYSAGSIPLMAAG